MARRRGYEMRLFIDSVAYRARKYEATDEVDKLDDWDSEHGQFKSTLDGGRQASIVLDNATYDEEANLFGAPLELIPGTVHHIEIFPEESLEPLDFPEARLMSVGLSGDVPGLQPVKLSFVTISEYTLPGEGS